MRPGWVTPGGQRCSEATLQEGRADTWEPEGSGKTPRPVTAWSSALNGSTARKWVSRGWGPSCYLQPPGAQQGWTEETGSGAGGRVIPPALGKMSHACPFTPANKFVPRWPRELRLAWKRGSAWTWGRTLDSITSGSLPTKSK